MTDMVIVLQSIFIINNWELLQEDWNFPEGYRSADEFLLEARKGNVVIGGAKIVIQDNLPEI